MSTITERVRAGMALLDEQAPGWERRIDVGRLDLQSCTACVLGQLFGQYTAGTDRLLKRKYVRPSDVGFNHDDRAWSYENLTRAWKRAIRARLADQARTTGSDDR